MKRYFKGLDSGLDTDFSDFRVWIQVWDLNFSDVDKLENPKDSKPKREFKSEKSEIQNPIFFG